MKELGDAPGFSSAFILTGQRVRYEVKEVLKGSLPEREFIGAHVIAVGSLWQIEIKADYRRRFLLKLTVCCFS